MNATLQSAHDALIQTPEFAAFLEAGGTVESLPLTMGVLRSRIAHIESMAWLSRQPTPPRMRNEDAYHEMPADNTTETYK